MKLVLELPEEVGEGLQTAAEAEGRTAEQVALDLLLAAFRSDAAQETQEAEEVVTAGRAALADIAAGRTYSEEEANALLPEMIEQARTRIRAARRLSSGEAASRG
jgi:hypothetical protein